MRLLRSEEDTNVFRSILSALVITLMSHAAQAQAPGRNAVTRESTITATVDRIERSSRVVTFRSAELGTIRRPGEEGFQSVYVDPSVKAFDDLKVGDVVTVRYVESVVVQVRPGAALSNPRDVTADAQKAGNGQVLEQQTAVVKVESINPQGLSIEYRRQDGQKILRPVQDKRLLEGLHVGDRIEVTFTRERAVSIEKARR
jgi:hypothetical protein